ncbi:MAG TPA: SCO family protein [Gammaproteobacteria bacterium]|nr:SCO family protein [Gammaproteobacteria bacterium]
MTESTSSRGMPLYLVLAIITGILAGIWWAQKTPAEPVTIAGTLLSPARPIAAFHMTDHQQKDFDNRRLQGKWSFLFFGYTNCPDVCPTTLFLFKMLAAKLQPELYKNTQFVFISVDPERDTTDVLARYMKYYNPDFTGLTGTPAEIKQFALAFGIPYFVDKHEAGQTNYMVDHSGIIILVNPKGEFQAVFSAPQKLDNMYTDYLKIIDNYP